MTLRTRKPTGAVPYPLVLVEGEEKSGKSFASYSLSASPRVGRTFVFDLGEGVADEYAELGPYEVVEHNGTFSDLLAQMRAACEEPQVDGKPNVIVLDDCTALWELLKDWASARARDSKAGRRKLADDPDAEVDIPMNLWNDAKDRWYAVLNLLRGWSGIGVLIARGKEVSKVVGGQPVAGQTEWKVEAEKSTAFAVTAWVRMQRPHRATLIALRKLGFDVPSKGLPLAEPNPLEHLVFEVIGAGVDFTASSRIEPTLGLDRAKAKNALLDMIRRAGVPADEHIAVATDLWATTGDPGELTEEQWEILQEVARVRLAQRNDGIAERQASMRRQPAVVPPGQDEDQPVDVEADSAGELPLDEAAS